MFLVESFSRLLVDVWMHIDNIFKFKLINWTIEYLLAPNDTESEIWNGLLMSNWEFMVIPLDLILVDFIIASNRKKMIHF